MTHDEMIAVIVAHRDGAKICCESKASGFFFVTKTPSWNFTEYDFRIAEARWRDATIDDLKRVPLKCRVRNCDDCGWSTSKLIGYSANAVQKWRTDDFLWHTQCQVIDE